MHPRLTYFIDQMGIIAIYKVYLYTNVDLAKFSLYNSSIRNGM